MDLFTQIFSQISDASASGAQSTGSVADFLIRSGLSVAAITQILNGVATSAQATPGMIDYVQQEMRYAQQRALDAQNSNKSGLWIVLGIGALLLLSQQKN